MDVAALLRSPPDKEEARAMADSLLGTLSELATPEVLGQISKMMGVDASSLGKGLGAIGATALGSMANSASTGDGLKTTRA